MRIVFSTNTNEILYRVKQEAWRIGEQLKGGSQADIERAARIQAGDEDNDTLNAYIKSGISEIVDLMSPYFQEIRGDELICDMPGSFPPYLTDSVNEKITDYITAFTLNEWLKRSFPNFVDMSRLGNIFSDINHKLNQRTSFVRRKTLPLDF